MAIKFNIVLGTKHYSLLLNYTVVHIGFIGPPFEGREKDGIVTVTFGVLGHTELDEAVPVTLNTLDISNINNAAEGKLSVIVL